MAFRDVLLVVVLTVGGLLLGASCRRRAPDLPVYDTPGWEDAYQLLLRGSSPDAADLLLRTVTPTEAAGADLAASVPPPDSVIYRYQPGAERLEPVGAAAWTAATGVVCDCRAEAQTIDPFAFDLPSGTLKFQGRVLSTAKPTVVNAVASPSGRYVAVFSAKRKQHFSLSPVPFIGGGGWSYEEQYHEVFERSDGTRVGKPVALPPPEMWIPAPCWSYDERYVVYVSEAKLCIVPTNLKQGDDQ
ncbi:MAG TPA: hypothetical protein PKK06_06125 [Phycisphaerae bacterium]|nr:hypothetical protein [Phycisphaerae bacterium]HNU44229.1 hypothetical protein [Phycisphaerae bacterium]